MNFQNGDLIKFHYVNNEKESEFRSGVWLALLVIRGKEFAFIRDYRDGKEKTFRIDKMKNPALAKSITAKYRDGEKVFGR